MTDEEILFDFFTVQNNIRQIEDLEEEPSDDFELPPINPGETRSFSVKADRKEFEAWFKENIGKDLKKFL
jgi:hypothetical protein